MQAFAGHRHPCQLLRQLQPTNPGIASSLSEVLPLPPHCPIRTQEILRASGWCPRVIHSAWKGGPEAWMNRLSLGGWRARGCISAAGNERKKDVHLPPAASNPPPYCIPFLPPHVSSSLPPWLPLASPRACFIPSQPSGLLSRM